MTFKPDKHSDPRDERTEEVSPQAGDATGAWQAGPEASSATVDLPPSPPASEPGAGAATGEWQSGQEKSSVTFEVPVEVPDDGATGVFVPESSAAQADAGGATTNFVPGQADRTTGNTRDPNLDSEPGGTTNFVPERDGSTCAGALSFDDQTASGRDMRSLSRQVLGKQRDPADSTGGGRNRTPEAPDLPSGRYQLKKFHARGGMGEIWVAEDQDIDRSVALKKMRAGANAKQKDSFLREAQITGQLEHPGVVPVHELSEDENGEPFYVMKFVKGGTLTDCINEYHGPANPGAVPREVQGLRLLQNFLNICQTVAFAHSQKIIHRDLKPDNVMVGPYGETLLLDWGLAKTVGQTDTPGTPGAVRYSYSGESLETLDGVVKGTPSYMSPEVAEGNMAAVDESSDIYLLGGTLYHILTGQKPRSAKRVTEYIELARTKLPVPPRKLKPEIPKPLEAICLKALAHRKEDRYATAQALAEDVQRHLAGEPVSAYQENLWERTLRWVKRHRVALGRTAVAALVLGLVLFGVTELRKAEERAELTRQENERKLAAEADKRAQAEKEAEDLQRQKKADDDVRAFGLALDDVQRLFALQDPSTEHLLSPGADQTERKAEEALALLRPWGQKLHDLPLSAEQRAVLLPQLYAVTLLLAETKSRRGTRKEAARDVLALLDQAAALRAPTSGLRRLQAECRQLLGDGAEAAAAQALAEAKETPTSALDHFLAAERLRVDHARATAGRAQQTWTKEQQQQLDRAIETYRQAIALDYNHFWSHFQLSQCYLTIRKEELALNALDACVALRPDSAWGYTLRGHVLALVRRFPEARADLERAMKLDADLREPRLHRGVVHWLQKQYDEALADFAAVLEPPVQRRLIEAAFYRGQLHLERGEEAKALDDFTLVIKERPQGHPASLRRARIHFGRGDVKLAMADLDAFLAGGTALDPQSPQLYAERGRRMRLMFPELPRPVRKTHLLMSLEQLQTAVTRGARSAAVFEELGAVLEFLGRIPEAVEAYTAAVALAPKEVRLSVKRAWAYEKLDQYDDAAADFAAAIRLDPAHAEAQAGLAYIQACQGKAPAEASRLATQAVLQGAGDYLILHNVACVYGKLSDRDPKRVREYQDLALVILQREVELWRRDRTGPDPLLLIRGDSAFPPALRARPEFQKLIREEP